MSSSTKRFALLTLSAMFALTLVASLDLWLGYTLEHRLSMLPFYLVPIAAAAWWMRGRVWVFLCCYTGVVWFFAQWLDPHNKTPLPSIVFNGVFARLTVFFIVGGLVSIVRHMRDRRPEEVQDATGLLTRRGLSLALEDPGRIGEAGTPPAAIFMIDVEHSLAYSGGQRREHAALISALVASAMRDSARDGDFCVRLGQDQYAVLMPRIRIPDAEAIASRFLTTLPALRDGVKAGFSVTTLLCTTEMRGIDAPGLLREVESSMTGVKASAPGRHTQISLDQGSPGAHGLRPVAT